MCAQRLRVLRIELFKDEDVAFSSRHVDVTECRTLMKKCRSSIVNDWG